MSIGKDVTFKQQTFDLDDVVKKPYEQPKPKQPTNRELWGRTRTPITKALSGRNRKILNLLDVLGALDTAEINKKTGLPESTIKVELEYLQTLGYVVRVL